MPLFKAFAELIGLAAVATEAGTAAKVLEVVGKSATTLGLAAAGGADAKFGKYTLSASAITQQVNAQLKAGGIAYTDAKGVECNLVLTDATSKALVKSEVISWCMGNYCATTLGANGIAGAMDRIYKIAREQTIEAITEERFDWVNIKPSSEVVQFIKANKVEFDAILKAKNE